MIVYLARDIRPFVMYCVNGKPRSSLLIESTDSMIELQVGSRNREYNVTEGQSQSVCVELNGALQRLFLCNIANVTERTFEIVQKSRSRKHGDIINYRRSGFFRRDKFSCF